jgi:hypothetical protein
MSRMRSTSRPSSSTVTVTLTAWFGTASIISETRRRRAGTTAPDHVQAAARLPTSGVEPPNSRPPDSRWRTASLCRVVLRTSAAHRRGAALRALTTTPSARIGPRGRLAPSVPQRRVATFCRSTPPQPGAPLATGGPGRGDGMDEGRAAAVLLAVRGDAPGGERDHGAQGTVRVDRSARSWSGPRTSPAASWRRFSCSPS